MLKHLPSDRSKRWFLTGLLLSLVGFAAYVLGYVGLLNKSIDSLALLPMALIFLFLGLAFSLLGYFGLRLWLALSVLGYISGLGLLLYYLSLEMSGWADLAAFASFLVMLAGGFAVGAVAQISLVLYHRFKPKVK